jgi:hypothetical protein
MKKLPVVTKYYLDQFVAAAEKQMPHSPLDWRRFYDFTYIAHKGRTKLSDGELMKLLKDVGFDSNDAQELAIVYQHGRALLKRKPNPAYLQLKAEISRKR